MSAVEKAEVLTKVASSGLPKGRVLRELGVPRSAYYRWLRWKECWQRAKVGQFMTREIRDRIEVW